jgi:anti-sigma B factor antagonist
MLLQISTRTFGEATIVDCSGRIVFGEETTALRDRVKDVLSGTKQIVVNLANVNYIDSSGVGTLMGLYASVQAAGGVIKMAGLTGRVKDVLVITRLATFFETFATAEEAASSFNPAAGKTKAVEWAS